MPRAPLRAVLALLLPLQASAQTVVAPVTVHVAPGLGAVGTSMAGGGAMTMSLAPSLGALPTGLSAVLPTGAALVPRTPAASVVAHTAPAVGKASVRSTMDLGGGTSARAGAVGRSPTDFGGGTSARYRAVAGAQGEQPGEEGTTAVSALAAFAEPRRDGPALLRETFDGGRLGVAASDDATVSPAGGWTSGGPSLRRYGVSPDPISRVPASAAGTPAAPRPLLSRAKLASMVAVLKVGYEVRRLAAKPYRGGLAAFQWAAEHGGKIWRKYVSGQEMDAHTFRWHVIEKLHKEGDFRGSFGHPVHEGAVEVMSPVIFPAQAAADIKGQNIALGDAELGPMISISGMSFPQLSAQSHLSLLYAHLKLAKDGVRQLYNTGEGGPRLHLGLLEGDASKIVDEIVEWNVSNGQFKLGSWKEAKAVLFVRELMKARDKVFAGFSAADLAKAQIVAQFGSALNGIRAPGNTVDWAKLEAVAKSPFVAMVQFKLKQAAKRGAKVDPRKVDDIVAAFRDTPRDKPFKSPELNPQMDSYEHVAALVRRTRELSGKPVSLKFGVGDPQDLYAFLAFLRDADALPEHLQIDGRGEGFSPGSGNAPSGANTSLPLNEAVLVTDAILKKLGVRDRVLLDATGDILWPVDAVEKLALGADCVSSGRGWMGMGLGCAMVTECAKGKCPYGIAAKSDSFVGLALDPSKVGPMGAAAAANWHKTFAQTLAEAGVKDWREFRKVRGLASGSGIVRKKQGLLMKALDRIYTPDYAADLLRGVLTREEVDRLVFGR